MLHMSGMFQSTEKTDNLQQKMTVILFWAKLKSNTHNESLALYFIMLEPSTTQFYQLSMQLHYNKQTQP